MRNYIEFFYDTKNRFVAEIHKDGQVRVIYDKTNIKKLISIAQRYGYRVKGEGYIKANALSITREYEHFYKKRKRIQILGNISSHMKLSRKNKVSKQTVVAGTLAAIIILTSMSSLNHIDVEASNGNGIRYETITDDNFDPEELCKIVYDDEIITEQENDNDVIEEETPEEIETKKKTELHEMLQEDSFHFSYKNRQSNERLQNAKRYEDLFQKYGKMFGIDPNLLIAIAAQESSGKHYENLDKGCAAGIMQIEKSVWIGHTVSAYNFETGKVETLSVTSDNIRDLETNIKIGTMIARKSMEDSNYNIPLGLQTYNFGPGNISSVLNACCSQENVDKKDVKNDPTNNLWLNYRAFLHTGDAQYVEHVFSFLDNNAEITVLDRDGNNRTVKLSNDYQEENIR